VVTDLVNFLEYVGEPAKLKRQQMGKYVLFFILIIGFIGYLLKKEYWKDIH
ncbi:MAG: cytochrome c1, partial [Methylococcales bacterium]|nr:cytochrome c1 [Methylococcales bacterium]